jgi:hypothetical protein
MKSDKCELPSYYEAQRFWTEGNPLPVVGTYLQRALLIGVPLYLVNGKPIESTKNALIASLAVEMYVLYKAYHFVKDCNNTPRTNGVPLDYTDGLHFSPWT